MASTAASLSLPEALAALYATFSHQQLRKLPEACPCCITAAESWVLFTVPLADQTEAQLQRYAFKAMTTWGNAADFRYFLPRLLELSLRLDAAIEKETVFSKLELAGWTSWGPAEQAAVRQVLRAWWAHHIQQECFFEEELLGWLIRLTGSIQPLLQAWQPAETDWAFENLVRTVPVLSDLEQHIRTRNPEDASRHIAALRQWLGQQLPILEAGFFQEETRNEEFAQAISLAHTLVAVLPTTGTLL
ncbi:hypothetical protein [Hymenobacter swuensis]|uniref:Uncharacterized protein n=1 Tax=Hymenobacter swuensis DY53 TaxID=1227739 RepID=W8EZH9_9BACT|nr:hypothetical protein [Hymenobacter swuensis]AHJ97172.1 hypothetical protein Hsw_1577 [Hymenobacter swuensis DY53]